MTLVEVMVAFFILVAGIGSLMTVIYRVSAAREESFLRISAMSEVERVAAAVMAYTGSNFELYSFFNEPPFIVIKPEHTMEPPDENTAIIVIKDEHTTEWPVENTAMARVTITKYFAAVNSPGGSPLKAGLTLLRYDPGE